MSNFELRPRFRRKTHLSQTEITDRIQKHLDEENSSVVGYISEHHVILKIPAKDRHYWSPELHLEIEAEGNVSIIKGLFGPRPSVWFMFVFFYTLLGFISMVIMIVGFSRLNLGLSSQILWALPIILVLIGLVYSTAKTGQKLGHDEMYILYYFTEDCLEKNWERI